MYVFLRLLLLGLMVLCIGHARAIADPEPKVDKVKVAKQYVDAGLAAQSAGDYDTAITMYEKAYQLAAHPVLIFNMAQAHRLAGHIEQALSLYAKYLAVDPNGAQAQLARDLVAEIEARKAEEARKVEEARKAEEAHKAEEARKAGGKTAGTSRTEPSAGGASHAIPDVPTTGGQSNGTLIVTAKSQSGVAIVNGSVMLDEVSKGTLASGKLEVTGIAEGSHTVAIEVDGYRRFEETVTVHGGQQASLEARLLEAAPSPPRHSLAWKVSLGASLAVTTTAGAFALYSGFRMRSDAIHVTSMPTSLSSKDCGTAPATLSGADRVYFENACAWHTRSIIGYIVTGVGAVGTLVSAIMLIRDPRPSEAGAAATAKSSRVSITPILTPAGGGASVLLTW